MGCQAQSSPQIVTPQAGGPRHREKKDPKPNSSGINQNTKMLQIPIRLQWQNHNGYCGETSIQACSIYYGNYISQIRVRQIAGSEVLLGQNAEQTVKKLGYDMQVWQNTTNSKPQYKKYLQWIKKMISQGYPVITCGYYPEGKNEQYDHIYLAVGFNSKNIQQYSDQDQLVYMDLFDQEYTVTSFGEIWDTRAMDGNGKELSFAIPRDNNYGIAVKPPKDPNQQFYPIRLQLQDDREPNVSLKQQPKQFSYKLTVSMLQEGKSYALLKYDNYKKLPIQSVKKADAVSVKKFVADGQTYQQNEKIQSDGCVFWRCVDQADLE